MARRRRLRLPEGWVVCAGFVDLQVNGLGGAQVGQDPAQNAHVAALLPRHGVTAFCPTLVTRPDDAFRAAAAGLAGAPWPPRGARSLGVHLEGPLLSPERPGVHPVDVIRASSATGVLRLVELLEPRVVTLAPERDGAREVIATAARGGALVSIGHTDADAEATRRAIDAGARMVTHTLNAMRPPTARDPGPFGVSLTDPRVRVGVIADGVHVAPELLRVISRATGARLLAVSDAVAATAAAPGDYDLGGIRVHTDGAHVVDDAGRLAGSATALDAAPRVLRGAGVSRAAALDAVSGAPRRALGLPPGLRDGAVADVVVVDERDRPRLTLIGGDVAWAHESLAATLDQ